MKESIDHEHATKHVEGEKLTERVTGIIGVHSCIFVEYVSYKET